MNPIDYVFYRLHLNYEKGGEDAPFTTILYFTVKGFFLTYPLIIFLLTLFNLKFNGFINLIYCLLIYICVRRYYNKKKIAQVKKICKNHPYNKTIKGWIFYIPGWILIFGGLLGSVPASRLAKWILTNWIV